VLHNVADPIYKEAYTYTTASGVAHLAAYKAFSVDNKMIGSELYFADGHKQYVFSIDSNGTSDTTRYAAGGVITSDAVIYKNGTTDTKAYTSGLLTHETIVLKTADASGATKYVYDFNISDAAYASKVTSYNAFGAVISTKTSADAVGPTVLGPSTDAGPIVPPPHLETPTLNLSTAMPPMIAAFAAASVAADNGGDPMIVGTGAPGSSIALYRGDAQIAVTKADADGHFSFTVESLADGSQILTAKTFDASGRFSDASESVAVNVFHSHGDGTAVAGSVGADFLFGTSGADSFVINHPGDVIFDHGGVDLATSSISYALPDGVENLRLAGRDHISGIGNAVDNLITGNDGNNLIDGSGGADRMAGGLGNDTYVVDNRNDKIVESAGQGIDTVQSSVTYSLGANIENLTLTGTGKIGGTGNTLANTLIGNSNTNSLSGGAGNDRLDGSHGSDVLTGGAGADSFVFSTIVGPNNVDTITDFEHGRDHIELASDIFNALQPGVLDASQFKDVASGPATGHEVILYNSTSGALYYDADGAGANAAVRIATLTGHSVLTADDFLIV
jgi:Ca2+-binding RTX toxin-like protein